MLQSMLTFSRTILFYSNEVFWGGLSRLFWIFCNAFAIETLRGTGESRVECRYYGNIHHHVSLITHRE